MRYVVTIIPSLLDIISPYAYENRNIFNSSYGKKWFCIVKKIPNNNELSFIGRELVDDCTHHKNYIVNKMHIVATAFILNNNDVSGGSIYITIVLPTLES